MAISLSSNPGMALSAGAEQAFNPADNYNDIASLDKLRASAQQDSKGSLRQVAQQFESIFMNMVLKSMRDANAAFESDLTNTNYTKFYRDMSDQQLSMNMSEQGALGLADVMVEQLDPSQSKITPASLLRHSEATRVQAGVASSIAPLSLPDSPKELSSKTKAPLLSAADPAPKQPSFSGPEDFINQLMPLARQTAAALGVDEKAILSQAALETGWGQKIIKNPDGSSSFNLFNIKASGGWQGDKTQVSTLEFEQGVAVKKQASFRRYENFQESFNDYKDFLSNSGRYDKSLSKGDDSAGFLHELHQAGYATDPHYSSKALSVLKRVTGVLNQ